MHMHLVTSLNVQDVFLLHVMCVLSGVNCNVHVPGYKIVLVPIFGRSRIHILAQRPVV